MKRSNKTLYEKIMRNVSKAIRNILNESISPEENDLILDEFLESVNHFCVVNALGDGGARYFIAAYTDEEMFNQLSKTLNISRNAIDVFEELLSDITYEYMTDVNNGITYDMAYDRYCELYR